MNIRITRAGIKTVARFIVSRSVSTTVSMLVQQNTLPSSKLEIASVHVGAFVLGEMVGNAAKSHIDEQIDSIADGIEKAHNSAKTNS